MAKDRGITGAAPPRWRGSAAHAGPPRGRRITTPRTGAEPGQPARRKRGPLGKPRLLIIGCGDIGARIVARLAPRFRIFGLGASGARAPALRAAGAVPLTADLDAPLRAATWRRLRGLAGYVMHLAPSPGGGAGDPRTRRVLAALAAPAGAPYAFVYVSTTGVYGDRGGAWIDETAPARPGTARARRRLDAEQRARRASWHAAVLRAPGIYAADRLPLERLRRGLPALAADADVYTNHIHAEDLARLCIAALARGARGRLYNAVDASCIKMGDFLDLVARTQHLPPPPRAAAAAVQQAVSPAMWTFMSESRRIRGRRIGTELRTRLLFPTVGDGLRAAAAAMAAAPDDRESGP